ncbi:adenylate/guanylate cyclase domain-containing protein [Dyadobacter psychrotolerans]|uniref:Uncharacterized protein n=1 Tax=Dyadobacter psychrotolerans TaxID=2541721 RepID=A0A4R5DW27_9BACT|nr:adenylate/guanylate cyclase domain-containing protein [Dyadobacter psychrotolerans]TDE16351.1 hypothetical protein E0F88_08875 [Dyadobacter psychrotolerans]
MEIYKSYLDNIRAALANEIQLSAPEVMFNEDRKRSLLEEQKQLLKKTKNAQPLPSLQDLSSDWGLRPALNQKLGLHPDFQHLKYENGVEYHYIHSMFIDIKGSTNLFKYYSPLVVAIVTNTIQIAAIHTCMVFGGYIQRLHGDGTLVYFGGKQQTRSDSVQRCLSAASLFTHFMKTDIKSFFESRGIKPIYTRIGIDYGNDDDVLWMLAGAGEASEVTTCSLHTSLAPKMQANAKGNGIVVGDNVVGLFPSEFYSPVAARLGEEHRYIFRNQAKNFNYTQYDFDWETYLVQNEHIATNHFNGTIHIKPRQVKVVQPTTGLASIAAVSNPYYGNQVG